MDTGACIKEPEPRAYDRYVYIVISYLQFWETVLALIALHGVYQAKREMSMFGCVVSCFGNSNMLSGTQGRSHEFQ